MGVPWKSERYSSCHTVDTYHEYLAAEALLFVFGAQKVRRSVAHTQSPGNAPPPRKPPPIAPSRARCVFRVTVSRLRSGRTPRVGDELRPCRNGDSQASMEPPSSFSLNACTVKQREMGALWGHQRTVAPAFSPWSPMCQRVTFSLLPLCPLIQSNSHHALLCNVRIGMRSKESKCWDIQSNGSGLVPLRNVTIYHQIFHRGRLLSRPRLRYLSI